MTAAYYRGVMGALIVYDITKLDSFERCEQWLRELRAHTEPSIVAMLVGNKCDLRHKQAVNVEDAKDFAEDNNLVSKHPLVPLLHKTIRHSRALLIHSPEYVCLPFVCIGVHRDERT